MGTFFHTTAGEGLRRRDEVLTKLSEATTTTQPIPLHRAAMEGDLDCLKLLLAESVDLNAPDSGGCTPLHLAAMANFHCVRELIAMGAETEVVDNSGLNPLHYAAMHGSVACISELRAVDVSAADNDGWTPLHHAALHGHSDCLEELMAMHADINANDCSGWTPLHQAAMYGNVKCLQKLMAKGADVNAADNFGCTPLHHSTSEGYLDCVIALFETRCEAREKVVAHAICQSTKLSEYPCSVITEMARPQPDVFIANFEGDRPIDHAREIADAEIVDFLRSRELFFR